MGPLWTFVFIRTILETWQGLKASTIGMITGMIWLLLIAAKKYSTKRVANSTPPQFDPSSYQCRLVQAMRQRGLNYREIVPNSWEQMEIIWKKDVNVVERFRIEGLVDPGSSWVYDINVRLWNYGSVIVQFTPQEENPSTKAGVLIKQDVKAGGGLA